MIAILMAVSVVNLSGITVTAPVDADANLVSRNILADGTIGECRRMMEDRPGWMPYQCATGPFLGQSTYRPLAPHDDGGGAEWVDPLQAAASQRSARIELQKTRNDGDN